MSIRSNIHFVNNLDLVGTDRFAKVRPMFDAVRNRCQQLIVEEFVSIDEQIVQFTGQLSVKQYIKGKPTPMAKKCMHCMASLAFYMISFCNKEAELK